jgi:hypothetical protein
MIHEAFRLAAVEALRIEMSYNDVSREKGIEGEINVPTISWPDHMKVRFWKCIGKKHAVIIRLLVSPARVAP